MCPLKEAAKDAPNAIALYSKTRSYTYAELDRDPGIHPVTAFLAAWRKDQGIFIADPKIPNPPIIENAPPQTLLIKTSGSTGTPKIAILSKRALLANAAHTTLDLRPSDRWLLSLPTYHVGGIGIILRCLLARATICLDDHPDITHLSYVPTQLYRATPVYKKLRCVLIGGAPTPSTPYFTTYGLTEMCSMVTLNGEILPKRELKLAEDGEIFVQGPMLFDGYLGESPHTGWFPTGDLGKIINGKLEILGRKDWMFISGGENIQPEEIEQHLLQMPDVLEAIVIPKNDPEFGKRPVAIIRAQNMFDLETMRAFLQERLPKFKIPIELYFTEEFPKKSNFKINRLMISQLINNQRDKNFSGQKKLPCL